MESGYERRKKAFGLCQICGHVREYDEHEGARCPMKDMVVRCLVCGQCHVACPPCEKNEVKQMEKKDIFGECTIGTCEYKFGESDLQYRLGKKWSMEGNTAVIRVSNEVVVGISFGKERFGNGHNYYARYNGGFASIKKFMDAFPQWVPCCEIKF